jgi:hypothetical protein
MKVNIAGIILAFTLLAPLAKAAPHVPVGIVSDWTHRHILFPNSKNPLVMARIKKDPRWTHNWYLRHPGAWWPEYHRGPGKEGKGSHRDWSVPLAGSFGFTYSMWDPDTGDYDAGYGSFTMTDMGGGELFATGGALTATGQRDTGTYPLYSGGPGAVISPSGFFEYDNDLYPSGDQFVDYWGLLFYTPNSTPSDEFEINIWGNGAGAGYTYDDNRSGLQTTGTFTLNNLDPVLNAAQNYPAKFVFDVTAQPSCASDYVVMGIQANASGGQANIIGLNNLYSSQGASTSAPLCGTNGPTVMFAYASGSGQVPAPVVISWNGTQIAYIENLTTGSSYFHVLTLGTTSHEGVNAMGAVVPGTGGSNAVDQRVLLSPDGGVTNQSSTNAVFYDYCHGAAYATTIGNGSGYLYKLGNVFNGSATPTIVWSVPIAAVPSTPVYDWVSNNVFFTDGEGRIDYVKDNGTSPSAVVYGAVLAAGTTSLNPVVLDITNEMVYTSFNSSMTNAVVVQAPIANMAKAVSASVGPADTTYPGPYIPDFDNAWYTGSGTPLLYIAGTAVPVPPETGPGTIPTLYSVGFNGSGVMNNLADTTTAALTTGPADSSPVTEFYNAALSTDYLFVGVTNHCIATAGGGSAGCVMSLDMTGGFPTVDAGTTALPAAGGTTGIIVDNNSSATEASSIYYGTQTGETLVKATQSGLN